MEQSPAQSRKALGIFLFFNFALSSIFYFLILHAGKLGSGGGLYVTGLMYCPSLSAFITCRILKRKISSLGWQWGNPRYQLWAYLVPLIYSLAAYLIIWGMGWGGFYKVAFVNDIAKSFGWGRLPNGVVICCFLFFWGFMELSAVYQGLWAKRPAGVVFWCPRYPKITAIPKLR